MADKAYDHDDPMALVGCAVPGGDIESQARVFVEEYAGLGMTGEELLGLFANPAFAGTHRLYRILGRERIEAIVREVYRR